ncbi:hypothetical protein V4P56_04800 [Bartonella sp. B35(2025)]
MERRIHAMRKLYRRKLYYVTFRGCVVILCVAVCGFVGQRTINYFFPKKESVQQNFVSLDIPAFDLRIYCKEIAASVLPDMQQEAYYRCVNSESEAYFAIREMWDDLSDNVKGKCMKMVRPGDGNYFLLRDCFINEKESEQPKVRNYF